MTPEEAAEAGVPGATAADHRRTSRRRSLAARPRRVRCCRWADCNRVPPPRAPPRLRRRSVFRTGLTRTPPLRTRHCRRRRSVQRGPGSPVRWRQPRRWCRWRATPLRSTARGMPMRRRRGCSRNGVATPSPAPARAPTCAPSRAPGLAAPSSDQGPAAPLLPATSRLAPIPVPVVAPAQPRPPAAPAPEPSRGDPTTELPAGPVTAAALLHPRRQREIIEQAAGMTTRQVAGLLGDRRSAGGAAARHAARGGAGPLHLEGEHRPGVRARRRHCCGHARRCRSAARSRLRCPSAVPSPKGARSSATGCRAGGAGCRGRRPGAAQPRSRVRCTSPHAPPTPSSSAVGAVAAAHLPAAAFKPDRPLRAPPCCCRSRLILPLSAFAPWRPQRVRKCVIILADGAISRSPSSAWRRPTSGRE